MKNEWDSYHDDLVFDGPDNVFGAITDNDQYFLLNGVSIQSTSLGFRFSTYDSNKLIVDGMIAAGTDGITDGTAAANNDVFVSSSGRILVMSNGIEMAGDNARLCQSRRDIWIWGCRDSGY